MYNYFIRRGLSYGILVWSYNTDRLIKLQKRAVRVISKSKFNAHFYFLQILKIDDLHKLHVLTFSYKVIHKTIPQYLYINMIITQHSHISIHPYPTQNNKKTCSA